MYKVPSVHVIEGIIDEKCKNRGVMLHNFIQMSKGYPVMETASGCATMLYSKTTLC